MKKPHAKRRWILLVLLAVFAVLVAYSTQSGSEADALPTRSFSEMREDITKRKIDKIVVQPYIYKAEATYKNGKTFQVDLPTSYAAEDLTKLATQYDVQLEGDSDAGNLTSSPMRRILEAMIPMLLLLGILLFVFRRALPNRGTKKTEIQEHIKQRFTDVAGADEVIEEMQDVRQFLSSPERFEQLGAKVPKGVLLYGPPGTGKTLLARALAGEADVPFFAVSGSDFVEMYAGLGASRIRDLFRKAREKAPAIIFVDELDAIGRARSSGQADGGTREADQTLNALLTEMDGFEVGDTPVVVIAATNRLETLDPALVRPGRFDRRIPVDPPDKGGRRQILDTHAVGKPFTSSVDLDDLARRTSGMTGAELANVLNEAALVAARRDLDKIGPDEIEEAILRVLAGPAKQNRHMSEHERRVVAYHEAGHAVVGEHVGETIDKISIIPRGRSGGQTLTTGEDKMLLGPDDLKSRLAMLLAGRAAERAIFNVATSGARDDLVRANHLAETAINELGFADTAPLRVRRDEKARLGRELEVVREQEIEQLLVEQEQHADQILLDQREALDRVANELLVRETLTREEFLSLLGLPEEQGAQVPPAAEVVAAPVVDEQAGGLQA